MARADGPDEFDRIVEHLDLDLSFPDDPEPESASHDEKPTPQASAGQSWSRSPDPVDDDEPFYRHVEPRARPWRRGTTLAWAAVLGGPLALAVCSLLGYIVPRSLLAGLALLFVAGAVYLISQLPEHGPADRDDPDDGAVL